jgi:hypothetical protein
MQTFGPVFELLDPGIQAPKFLSDVFLHICLVFSINLLYLFDGVHGTWTVATGPPTDLLDQLQILYVVKYLTVKAID